MKKILFILLLCTSSAMAQTNILPNITLQHCSSCTMGSYTCYYGYDDNSHLQLILYKNNNLILKQDYGEGLQLYSIDTCHVMKNSVCDFLTVVYDENTFYFDLFSLPQGNAKYTVYHLIETASIDVRLPNFNNPLYQLYALQDTNHDGREDKLFIHILKNKSKIGYINEYNGTIKYDLDKIQE